MSQKAVYQAVATRILDHLRGALEQIRDLREAKTTIPPAMGELFLREIEAAVNNLPIVCRLLLQAIAAESDVPARLPDEIIERIVAVQRLRRCLRQFLELIAHHSGIAEIAQRGEFKHVVQEEPGVLSGNWDISRMRIHVIGEIIVQALHARHLLGK